MRGMIGKCSVCGWMECYCKEPRYGMLIPEYQIDMMVRAAQVIPIPAFYRANGDMVCYVCGQPYKMHPQAVPHFDLTMLCDGSHVKL